MGGLSALAYLPAVSRAMPSFRAMTRRESPCSLACCTASQRACWVWVGVRQLLANRFCLPAHALGGYALDVGLVVIGRFEGGQAFPLSLVQGLLTTPATPSCCSGPGEQALAAPHSAEEGGGPS